MVSSGITVGAWDDLKWSHLSPIVKHEKLPQKLMYTPARMMNTSSS
jgi:hypothetical protein